MKFQIDDKYWSRQFPQSVLQQLAENGRKCTDKDGRPLEDADPIPAVRLFMADGSGCWLLGFVYPNDPDRAYALADLGYGAELGDVRLSDLKEMRGALGLPIERDRQFKCTIPISQCAGAPTSQFSLPLVTTKGGAS
jgi:hypothetical protein